MPDKKKIYIILFSIVVLICLFGFLWSFVVTRNIRKEALSGASKNQVVTVKNLILTETKEKNLYWELYAAKGSYDSKTGDVILEKVLGNFYDSGNKVVLSFESDIGMYSENTKITVLNGNALIVAYDGSSITADKIILKGKDEDITAKGNVIVKRNQDFISTANEARFNSELTFFEIEGQTQTNVYSKDGGKPRALINRTEG